MSLHDGSFSELDFADTPHLNWIYGFRDAGIYVLLKTITYIGDLILLLAVTKNQYNIKIQIILLDHITDVYLKFSLYS